jgi:glycosyltransferase involved in cell wall biosynthesis
MDFLVIPSRWYENSPLVLLNALASHTPVIVSDVLGMTEFVISGENGFVFARGSVDALAACLSGLAAAGARRHGMELTTHYDLSTQRMTEETIRVYERAISKAGRVSELSATASGA